MVQEHNALKETNKYLENKVKVLTSENNSYIKAIMDLKEKQIEKLNEANDLIKELNDMKHNMQKIKQQKSTPELMINVEKEEFKKEEPFQNLTPKI